jgi:hypothetical protein
MSQWAVVILAALAGLAFAAAILLIARRGILSMRYTIGWLFVAACVAVGGLLGWLIDPLADALDVEPVMIVVAVAMMALLAITVQLSISVSGLTEASRTLAQSNALLEQRVHELEAHQSPSSTTGQ